MNIFDFYLQSETLDVIHMHDDKKEVQATVYAHWLEGYAADVCVRRKVVGLERIIDALKAEGAHELANRVQDFATFGKSNVGMEGRWVGDEWVDTDVHVRVYVKDNEADIVRTFSIPFSPRLEAIFNALL